MQTGRFQQSTDSRRHFSQPFLSRKKREITKNGAKQKKKAGQKNKKILHCPNDYKWRVVACYLCVPASFFGRPQQTRERNKSLP
jgi:hypothetical protein